MESKFSPTEWIGSHAATIVLCLVFVVSIIIYMNPMSFTISVVCGGVVSFAAVYLRYLPGENKKSKSIFDFLEIAIMVTGFVSFFFLQSTTLSRLDLSMSTYFGATMGMLVAENIFPKLFRQN